MDGKNSRFKLEIDGKAGHDRAAMDIKTLVVTMIAQVSLLGVLALYFSWRQPSTRAVGVWGAGMVMLAAGLAAVAMRGVVPDLISITLANTLVTASIVISYRALRVFKTMRVEDSFGLAAIAATAVLIFVFSEVIPNLAIRVLVMSVIGALLLVRNAREMRGEGPVEVRASWAYMQGVYWVAGALMGLRAVSTLFLAGDGDLMTSSPVQSAYFLAIFLLITAASFGAFWLEVQYMNYELSRQAARDLLTGMLNRRSFLIEFERELARLRRTSGVLSLAMFDLDHFKQLNDTHGHQAGDEMLRAVAAAMQAGIRLPDVLGRYGGEEFVLLMPDTGMDAARSVTERIRIAVEGVGVAWNGAQLTITLSGGIACFPVDGKSSASLIAAADAALYAAKRAGRNRILQAANPALSVDAGNTPPAGEGREASRTHARSPESIRNPP